MSDDEPLAAWRNADIPESWPKLRELREFMLRNPTPDGGVTDPEHREAVLNELYVRGGDVISEAVRKFRDKFGDAQP